MNKKIRKKIAEARERSRLRPRLGSIEERSKRADEKAHEIYLRGLKK